MQAHGDEKNAYIGVFLALMVLTGVTAAIAFVDLGALNTPVALAIAVFKATLVTLIFMHVRHSTKVTKVVVVAGFFWLLIMFVLTMSDYISRGWLAPGK